MEKFMLKNQVILEVKRGENIHRYYLPENCQAGEVCDVLFEMRGIVISKITESQALNKPVEQEQTNESEQKTIE
jgi:hypothetical protein